MTSEKKVVRLSFASDTLVGVERMTPKRVVELLEMHMKTNQTGVDGESPTYVHEARSLFNQLMHDLRLAEDDAAIGLLRNNDRIVALVARNQERLYLHIDTYERGDELREYIVRLTKKIPSDNGDEDVLVKIAPPENMSATALRRFIHVNSSDYVNAEVLRLIGKIWNDYPYSSEEQRNYLRASTQFHVSRAVAPSSNITDQNGVLYLEMAAADSIQNGRWNRIARMKMMTGWKVGQDDKWYETIIDIERVSGDEPKQYAYPGKAGIYNYIEEASDVDLPTLVNQILQGHLIGGAESTLHQMADIFAMRSAGALSFSVKRIVKGGAIDLPNSYGVLTISAKANNDVVGMINIRTQWTAPVIQDYSARKENFPDYIEVVSAMTLDEKVEARMRSIEQWRLQQFGNAESAERRWSNRGYPNPGFGHAGGCYGMPPFGTPGFNPLGSFGGNPMPGEEATLSAYSLESFGRVLTALTEKLAVRAVIPEVLKTLAVQREQYNHAQHGALMYQYELRPGFGLAVRAVSQSGAIHYQQIFPC
jgi:hypothetical protein